MVNDTVSSSHHATVDPLKDYPLYTGFVHMGAGIACGMTGMAAGYAIGCVGDAVCSSSYLHFYNN